MVRVSRRLVVTGVIGVLVVGGCGGGTEVAAPPAGESARSTATPSSDTAPRGELPAADGRTTTAVHRVEVGGSPCGVAVGFDAVWVSVTDDAELVRLDPATGAETGRLALSAKPCEITVTSDSLWVVTQSGVVDRVDPEALRLRSSVETGFASYQAAEAFGAVWVSNRGSQSLTRIDPDTEQTTTVELPGTNAGGLVAAGGALWVGDDTTGSGVVVRVDPESSQVREIEVGGDRPAYLAATGDTVWVSRVRSGTVSALDARTGQPVGEPVPAGSSPVNLHASPDGRWVWVPDDRGDLLTRIDAGTGAAVERLRVGSGPAVVAPTDDGVWVTNFGDGTVWFLRTDPG